MTKPPIDLTSLRAQAAAQLGFMPARVVELCDEVERLRAERDGLKTIIEVAGTEKLIADGIALRNERDIALDELTRLRNLIDSAAACTDFIRDVQLEAAHQVERWGVEHDAGKRPEDWFTLLQYLLGKAARAHFDGNRAKLLHHIVTGAAVFFNWWRRETGAEITMRPGVGPRDQEVRGG